MDPMEGVIDGLLTMHVRRGDYEKRWFSAQLCLHCANLHYHLYHTDCDWMSNWDVRYQGWNALSFLPDRIEHDLPENERRASVMQHCLPSISSIVHRARIVRWEHAKSHTSQNEDQEPPPGLTRVFIATNAENQWLKELKETLKADGWLDIVTTSDLELSWEQAGVGNAIGTFIVYP